MSEYAYAIRQMQDQLDEIKLRLTNLEAKATNDTAAEDIREQGHAIRNMTMVLERIVDHVFPEAKKPTE